jgi:hypothetical protein
MTRCYLACALTNVPRCKFTEYANAIHRLAAHLERRHRASVQYALINSDPQLALCKPKSRSRLCYRWDRSMVEHADLVVAECSFPSTGLGIELQIAEQAGIPIIVLHGLWNEETAPAPRYRNPDGSRHRLQVGRGVISLMILGLPSVVGVVRYTSMNGAIRGLDRAIKTHGRARSEPRVGRGGAKSDHASR